MPKFHWLIASSQDPTQVANTVRGLVLGSASIIILIVSLFFHVTLTSDNINMTADVLAADGGAIWMTYGLIMKIVVWFGAQKQQPTN